ncbi:MAG: AAC(3) family N-acetyltransferase [Clostridia bacterium]|nr:AAC(3) family N-acetyltransferase [Clostridia bacterium]
MLTREDIHQFLRHIGVRADSTVLVHTSMRSLGPVEGGCDGLIDDFTSYLTDGLFLVPTHTWANVNRSNPLYDVKTTVPCIGALPTVAAFRKDGIRSLHPTHSVAAFGKKAKEFVVGEETSQTPCPKGGVWVRLCAENTVILLLGVGLNRNTYIHAVDEILDLPDRLGEPYTVTVVDYDGKRMEHSFRPHHNAGSEYFENYRKPLEYFGALRQVSLGNASVGVCDPQKTAKMLRLLWGRAEYNLCEDFREIPENYYK